jgi:DNA-binding LacI/PurR family transcriptional regulator
VDGIIHAPCTPFGAAALAEHAEFPPVVEIVRRSRAGFDTFEFDDRAGARAVVGHLIEKGHRSILALAGPKGTSTTRNRVTGARDAVRSMGRDRVDLTVEHGEYSHTWGFEGLERALRRGQLPTAIFASSNQLASGVLAALAKHSIVIPDDTSVVALEDPDWFSAIIPGITTVNLPLEDLALQAAGGLVALMRSAAADSRHVKLAGDLVVRGSVAQPRTVIGAANSTMA